MICHSVVASSHMAKLVVPVGSKEFTILHTQGKKSGRAKLFLFLGSHCLHSTTGLLT